jgi:hypothetical protein
MASEETLKIGDVMLGDENLTSEQILARTQLAERILAVVPPETFESTHFLQTGVGCSNGCSFCSQEAGSVTRYYDEASMRTVLGGIQAAMRAQGVDRIGGKRPHKPGVIFPYLDNDIGSYPHLNALLDGISSMGGRTRLSTVSWSRRNPELQAMHHGIANNRQEAVDGIRFSFTPYTLGWRTNQSEYIQDFGNALATYQPFFEAKGVGRATGCIEVRFPPDITIDEMVEKSVGEYKLVRCGDYTLITRGQSLNELPVSKISKLTSRGPVINSEGVAALQLVGDISKLNEIAIEKLFASASSKQPTPDGASNLIAQKGAAFVFTNTDGNYYCFNPLKDSRSHFTGVHYYPKTEQRVRSGVLDASRPLLNNLLRFKESRGVGPREDLEDTTWNDVDTVLAAIKTEAETYRHYSEHRAAYITDQLLPLVQGVITAMHSAQLDASNFFRYGLLVDTGVIVNQGKAVREFHGLASRPDMPMTPNEEKGYGEESQKARGTTWRIAPVPASPETSLIQLKGYGRKSQPVESPIQKDSQLHLGFYEWDPGPYDNRNSRGEQLRFFMVAIGDLVSPLVEFNQKTARDTHFLPGY